MFESNDINGPSGGTQHSVMRDRIVFTSEFVIGWFEEPSQPFLNQNCARLEISSSLRSAVHCFRSIFIVWIDIFVELDSSSGFFFA